MKMLYKLGTYFQYDLYFTYLLRTLIKRLQSEFHFFFSCSKYRKCKHCAKTIAIMAKSMTNWKAVSSSHCFTHGGQIRGAARDKTGKTAVLPRFGASKSKTFSFKRSSITRSWSCLIKIHCNAPAEVVFLKCSALKFSPPRLATVSLQAYGGRADGGDGGGMAPDRQTNFSTRGYSIKVAIH